MDYSKDGGLRLVSMIFIGSSLVMFHFITNGLVGFKPEGLTHGGSVKITLRARLSVSALQAFAILVCL